MSGHYCTFVKAVFDDKGDLACVCGADLKFGWLSKELEWIDETSKSNRIMNKYKPLADFDFYTVIFNKDGTCIAHPDGKRVTMVDDPIVSDLEQKKSGVVDMKVNGISSTVYYGPIDHINWTVAIIVPQQSLTKNLLLPAAILLSTAVIGLLAVWLVCRRRKDAETI